MIAALSLASTEVLLGCSHTIYLDLGFYDLLSSQYGPSSGSLAEIYVVAGSSEQRQRWFTTGYEQGTLGACDTFAAASL